jgi:hypothetical protein
MGLFKTHKNKLVSHEIQVFNCFGRAEGHLYLTWVGALYIAVCGI